MIKLAEVYGDKIYYPKEILPKAYVTQFIIWDICFNLIIAFVITKVFGINWDYAILKVITKEFYIT